MIAMPKVKVYPLCGECRAPYVLRHAIFIMSSGNDGWVWQRDCKHKKAPPVANTEASKASALKAPAKALSGDES